MSCTPDLMTTAAVFLLGENKDFKSWSVDCLSNIASLPPHLPQYESFHLDRLPFFAVSAFPLPAGDYWSQEMKELPIREGAALYCTCCYGRLCILVSLQDKHDYIPRLCRFNHTPLPTSAIQPPAIFPDMCNQLEQQILAGIKRGEWNRK